MGPEAPVKLSQEIKDPASDSPKANILLVDDHQANLIALESVLSPLNQTLFKARSGEEALRHLLKHDMAVVLLDIHMPAMDGFETAALIRARASSNSIPIIFITAVNTRGEDVARGYSLGAVDYLFKPYSPDILKSKVSVFVELHRKSELLKRQAEHLHRMELRETELRERENRMKYLNRHAEILERQARSLARANTELETSTCEAARRLKEPLHALREFTQVLKHRLEDRRDRTANDCLRQIDESVARMETLIDGILSNARPPKAAG